MNYTGLIIAVATFIVIGIFHPIVIKAEYHVGRRIWPLFLATGILFLGISLFVQNNILSPILGVIGCSALWSIGEIIEQEQRVAKGWYPPNPKREQSKVKSSEVQR